MIPLIIAAVVAAAPTAVVVNGVVAASTTYLTTRLENRRVAKILEEVLEDRARMGTNEAAVKAHLDELCGKALNPLSPERIGRREFLVTEQQRKLLYEAAGEESSVKLRLLLNQIVAQNG